MTTVAIVQARMNSTRLPGKVMRPIARLPMIDFMLRRLTASKCIDRIVVATTDDSTDDALVQFLTANGYEVHRGNEKDVLDRYWSAAQSAEAEVIIRVTGDCPLIDPHLVDDVVRLYLSSGADYASNVDPPTFPDGLDVEVFSRATLEKTHAKASTTGDREHVTPFMRESGEFICVNLAGESDYSRIRLTVDEQVDLDVVSGVAAYFHPRLDFTWGEVLQLSEEQPELFEGNQDITRNAGSRMNTGQKLWNRAKAVIPGGSMLLSKRPEMFLPGEWPAYFSKTDGCNVWDLDGRRYVDMSVMGLGTNVLGYSRREVDEAVIGAVSKGNLSTLNCPEEVYLAERLVELHPWADMARFARTGGEANAIAIRLARASSGRDKVAICGYHGWHDWYLAANLADDQNLDGHLLPGLDPKGVPRALRDTVIPFRYDDIDALERILSDKDVGTVKMEVSRSTEPATEFLEAVRALTIERDVILIFDECTSGFRQALGGLHLAYGLEPDMTILGKTLGNGYAITAVIGRREVMQVGEESFISSTFWTERIGPTAALATLGVMQDIRSYETITTTGQSITRLWVELGAKYDLSIETSGLPALTAFRVASPNWNAYRTLIVQEMLKQGYLARDSVYVSVAHTETIVSEYFDALSPVFELIGECEGGSRDVRDLLDGPEAHTTFQRLN